MRTISLNKNIAPETDKSLAVLDETTLRRKDGLARRPSCANGPGLSHFPRSRPAILVAVDLLPTSLGALKHAAALAKRLDTSLLLLHVVNPVYTGGLLNMLTKQKVRQKARRRALAKIHALAQSYVDQDVPVTCDVREGLPEYEILRLAESRAVALIVLARPRRNLLGRWLWGSVSDDIIDIAPCPVLVVNSQPSICRQEHRLLRGHDTPIGYDRGASSEISETPEREQTTGLPVRRDRRFDWDMLALWAFVVLSFAALGFALLVIWAKCGGQSPF